MCFSQCHIATTRSFHGWLSSRPPNKGIVSVTAWWRHVGASMFVPLRKAFMATIISWTKITWNFFLYSHSLSARHDGDRNYCGEYLHNIMSPSFAPNEAYDRHSLWQFSSCSINYFDTFISQKVLTSWVRSGSCHVTPFLKSSQISFLNSFFRLSSHVYLSFTILSLFQLDIMCVFAMWQLTPCCPVLFINPNYSDSHILQ